MSSCPRPAVQSLVPLLCRWTQLVFRSSPSVCHPHRGSVAHRGGTNTLTTRRTHRDSPGSQGARRRMSSAAMGQRMVWVDLEMTGLDIDKDQIIEMACIITDAELKVVAEGPNLIIRQPDELLDGMSDWCKQHHGQSGLTQAVRDSNITLEQAEYEFLSFIRQHTPPGQCPLAGNSVHADMRFLQKYMPQFVHHLHYRIIDVSTIKELCRLQHTGV
ncbi:small fragment nuclease isoform X2 [Antennarius striatus]|uniref:small fragment nuclease isoform X2 n=1 Tax=Antennarius striatus TaxID=241820 RepID=UPI0035B2CD32